MCRVPTSATSASAWLIAARNRSIRARDESSLARASISSSRTSTSPALTLLAILDVDLDNSADNLRGDLGFVDQLNLARRCDRLHDLARAGFGERHLTWRSLQDLPVELKARFAALQVSHRQAADYRGQGDKNQEHSKHD